MSGWSQAVEPTGTGSPPPRRRGNEWVLIVAIAVVATIVGSAVLAVAAPRADEARWWQDGAGTDTSTSAPARSGGTAPRRAGPADPRPAPTERPAPALFAGGWGDPRFQGPHLVVVGEGIVQSFTDAVDPVLEWTFAGCEWPDWATPFVEHDVDAVVLSCDGDHVGLDPDDGSVRWRRPESPGVDRTRLAGSMLVMQSDARIEVVDVGSGALLWERTSYGEANVSVDATQVYVSNDVGVHALDAATGTPVWTTRIATSDVFAARDAVYARTNDHSVARLDKVTGGMVWRSAYEDSRLDWSAFMGETDHAVVLFTVEHGGQITVYDKGSGARRWIRDLDDEGAIVTVGADRVALHDVGAGVTELLDDVDGAEVTRFDGDLASPVAVSDRHVAYLGDDGSYDPVVVIDDLP